MCEGVVIEAHTIRLLRDDIARKRGTNYKMLKWLVENCGIVMTDKIKKHWEDNLHNRGEIVFDWLEQLNYNKSVNELKQIKKVHRDIKKKMRNDFGLTNQPFVVHYIDCANTTRKPKYIMAEDISFYDPKVEDEGHERKKEMKNRKTGRLQRYINDELKIKIRNIELCIKDVQSEDEDCSKKLSSSDCSLS